MNRILILRQEKTFRTMIVSSCFFKRGGGREDGDEKEEEEKRKNKTIAYKILCNYF